MDNKRDAARSRKRQHRKMATALIIVAAVCLVLILAGKREADDTPNRFSEYEAFTYEGGSGQTFSMMGAKLVTASSTGLQLLDENGLTVQRQVFSMERPAIAAADTLSAVYDIGGTTLRLCRPDGSYAVADTADAIIRADIGAGGELVVCTEETGYKGQVTVYDRELTARYRWHSGTGYLMDACISPDGRVLAAMCADSQGSEIHLFDVSETDELASCTAENELLLDVFFLNSSTLCAVSSRQVSFYDMKGSCTGTYPYGDNYLTDYACTKSGTLVLYLNRYRSGSAGSLVTLKSSGEELGTLALQRDIVSLCAGEKEILVQYSDGLVRYSQTLDVTGTSDGVSNARRALLTPAGDVLLLSSYSAEKYKF